MADWKMGGVAGVPIGAIPLPVANGGTGNATGDVSASLVTPAGASTARTMADVAADGYVQGLVAGSTAAATANTAKIQAALDAGGRVMIDAPRSGAVVYYVKAGGAYANTALAIGSNTRLEIAPNVTLRQAPGTHKNLLTTKSHQTARVPVTLTWSAGRTASVAWAAHPMSVGDFVCLQGSGQTAFVGTFVVTTVESSSAFTIILPVTPSAQPAGSTLAVKATTGFSVEGGVWDYDLPNNSGSNATNDAMAIILSYAQGFRVHDLRYVSVQKYCLQLCHVRDYAVSHQHAVNGLTAPGATDGDVVKVYGPAMNGDVSFVTGMSEDDAVSVQCQNPPAYSFFNFNDGGSITGCRLRNIGTDGVMTGTASVSIYLNPVWEMDDIEVDGVYGTTGDNQAKLLIFGDPGAAHSNRAGTIRVRGIKTANAGTYILLVDPNTSIQELVLEDFLINDPGFAYIRNAILLGGKIGTITLRDSRFQNIDGIIQTGASTLIDVLNIEGVTASQASAFVAMTGGTVNTINVRGSSLATDMPVASAVVAAGGSGYAVGDTITLAGGDFVTAAVLKVATLSGSAVATVTVQTPGSYRTRPANPVAQASTSGGGTAATFTVTWAVTIRPSLVSSVLASTVGTINLIGNTLDAGCNALVTANLNIGAFVANLIGNRSAAFAGVTTYFTSTVNARDNQFIGTTGATLGILRVWDAGATQVFKLRASGNDLGPGAALTRIGGAELVSVWSSDLPVSLAALQRTAASMAVASAGVGTIVAGNVAVCDATGVANSWHQLSNPALVY